MEVYNMHSSVAYKQHKISGKKKDDNFTEDSSMYAHGDEFTNAANINSNRLDLNLDGIGSISDEEDPANWFIYLEI